MTEQEEFEFRARLEAEQAAADRRPIAQRIAEDVGENAVNPFYASGAGGIGAMVLGGPLEAGYEAAAGRAGPTQAAASAKAARDSAGQRWARATGYGSGPGESVRDVRQHYLKENAPVGSGKVSKGVSRATPGTVQDAIERERQLALTAKARPLVEKLPGPVQATGRGVGAALEHMPKWATRGAAGANLGYQGADAYNRALAGDVPGAATSATGALGSGLFLLPGKYKKAIGAGMSIGSHLLNRAMDESREEPQGYAKGKAVKSGLDIIKKAFQPTETKIVKASEALGPHEGKYLHFTESDRMRSTGGDLGGPGFSKFQLEDPRYAEAQAAWGVASKPKATSIVNINKRFPEGQSLWTPLIGAEGQHRSNQHVYDALQNEFSRQASMGKLTPELRERMNKRLTTFPNYQKSNLQGIDVANPELLQQFGNTFDRRAAIAEVLGGEGVGGRKGQIFDYPGIMQEMADPMTFGAPTHSAGTRLFSLNNEVEFRPDLHSAFPHILKGQDLGVAFAPVPKELAFKDWLDMARDFMGREPQYMDFSRGVKHQGHGRPHQFIDERFLRRLEEAGHKQGGLIALEE